MILFVGLGNPGEKYQNNRHNIGYMFVDRLAGGAEWKESRSGKLLYAWTSLNGKEVELVKPLTFMNQSGVAVKRVISQHPGLKNEAIVVVHDDLDLPFGKCKIQKGTGPQLHNGVESIEKALGKKDFWRIRIGVDNRDPGRPVSGETYVLQNFTSDEAEKLLQIFEEIHIRLQQTILVNRG